MKFDVAHLGIRVVANPSMSGAPSLIRPHGIEGTVLFIESDEDYFVMVRDMVDMGQAIEIACAPNLDIGATIKVRWDNNRCSWVEHGSLSFRGSKGPRCNRIWFNNALMISENYLPLGMLDIKTKRNESKVFKIKWSDDDIAISNAKDSNKSRGSAKRPRYPYPSKSPSEYYNTRYNSGKPRQDLRQGAEVHGSIHSDGWTSRETSRNATYKSNYGGLISHGSGRSRMSDENKGRPIRHRDLSKQYAKYAMSSSELATGLSYEDVTAKYPHKDDAEMIDLPDLDFKWTTPPVVDISEPVSDNDLVIEPIAHEMAEELLTPSPSLNPFVVEASPNQAEARILRELSVTRISAEELMEKKKRKSAALRVFLDSKAKKANRRR